MSKNRHLIIIGGPTAIGKTTVAIELAQFFGLEILSADSRQFYKEMSIGTAKPSPEELIQAPHHFIDSLSIKDAFSVGDFERAALEKLDNLYQKQQAAILVGGSGMYLRAVCEGLDEFPDVSDIIKQKWMALFEKKGIGPLQKKLEQKDPAYFHEVDIQNPHRLIRALSVIEASGQSFSSFRQQKKKKRPFELIYILLEMDRAALYERINRRVDSMIKKGLVEEAKELYPQRHLNALQTVGYEELFQYFEGKHTLEEAIELIKRNTRRYAKRQMTWFRKREVWRRFSSTDIEGIKEYVAETIRD